MRRFFYEYKVNWDDYKYFVEVLTIPIAKLVYCALILLAIPLYTLAVIDRRRRRMKGE